MKRHLLYLFLFCLFLLPAFGSAFANPCCDPCCYYRGTGYSGGGWRYNPPGVGYVYGYGYEKDNGQWIVDKRCPKTPGGCSDPIVMDPPAAGPQVIERIKIIERRTLFFPVNRTLITASEDRHLRELALSWKENKDADVLVAHGHASPEGPIRRNDELGMLRAIAVVDRLVDLGIPRERVKVDHFGASRARAFKNSAEAQLELDRRVDIVMELKQ